MPARTSSAPPVAASARPFLKWAGGKRHLLPQLAPLFPAAFGRYVEPFVGSGAVFFHLRGEGRLGDALLADRNADLITTYEVVRDHVEPLMELLAEHAAAHSAEHYYRVRALDRKGAELSAVERAARTIYLNRTCYNGLYRVNSRGQFNVPLGRYRQPAVLQRDRLLTAHRALQGVVLHQIDYTNLVGEGAPGDFFYFDPPYQPVSATANFTAYTAGAFNADDQARLAAVYRALSDRGCRCMLSNSDSPLIRELYRDFRIETVQAARAINSRANGRGAVTELVICNY